MKNGFAIGAVPLLVALAVIFLRPAFYAPAAPMDEGMLLVYPEQMSKGRLPYRDFEEFYPPGNIWLLQVIYRTCGISVSTERAVGLFYRVALSLGLFFLVRKWHSLLALFSAFASIVLLSSLGDIVAFAWFAGIALVLWSFALIDCAHKNDDGETEAANPVRSFFSGFLAGTALMFRLDLAPAFALAAATLLWGMNWRRRKIFILGVVVPLLPLLGFVVICGWRSLAENLFLYPVFFQRPGRRLPIHGPYFGYVILTVSAAALSLLISAFAVKWKRNASCSRLLLAVSLFGIGICSHALQRPDETHVTMVACFVLAWSIVPLWHLAHSFIPRWHSAILATVSFTALLVFLPLARPEILRDSFAAAKLGLGQRFEPMTGARVRSRFFPISDEVAPSTEEICAHILRSGQPGQRLFVGPYDLRRTNYNDTFFYYLLPDFVPATYFLEMNPFSANRPHSRLAADLATADWVILDSALDLWNEPNASAQFGSSEPLGVLLRQFTFVAREGPYHLYRRISPGNS